MCVCDRLPTAGYASICADNLNASPSFIECFSLNVAINSGAMYARIPLSTIKLQ